MIKACSVKQIKQYNTLFSDFCGVKAQNDPIYLLIFFCVCLHCVNHCYIGYFFIAAIMNALKSVYKIILTEQMCIFHFHLGLVITYASCRSTSAVYSRTSIKTFVDSLQGPVAALSTEQARCTTSSKGKTTWRLNVA